MLAVLDTMMEPLEDGHNTHIVYYNILDGDEQGRPPNDQHFKKSDKTCLHKIAKSNNKASILVTSQIVLYSYTFMQHVTVVCSMTRPLLYIIMKRLITTSLLVPLYMVKGRYVYK